MRSQNPSGDHEYMTRRGMATVPSVLAMTASDAAETVRRAGFTPAFTSPLEVTDVTSGSDRVIAQRPHPGHRAPAGSAIELTVSDPDRADG
ncbi:PASTA domain-containing protein [Actinomadura opuntiae]|uniref:PASTA domain-containing protein n=1 Tax=Actinomadura sp. OS1-43 TaxID=604315 RepID=UPI00334086C7